MKSHNRSRRALCEIANLVLDGKDASHERLLSLFSKPKRSSPPAHTRHQSDSQYRRGQGGRY